MPSRLYLCGPCSSLPLYNAPAFAALEQEVQAHYARTQQQQFSDPSARVFPVIINPTTSGIDPDAPWEVHLKWCVAQVVSADALIHLDGWWRSRGASLETMLSITLGIPVHSWLDQQPVPMVPLTLAQLAEMPMLYRTFFQDRMVSLPEHIVIEGAFNEWYPQQVESDIKRTVPKAMAYGARGEDMIQIGKSMGQMRGADLNEQTAALLGCHFYILGKLARGDEAIRHGLKPSEDTMFDITIYLVMAMRIAETGHWGSSDESPLDEWWRIALSEQPDLHGSWQTLWDALKIFVNSMQKTFERGGTTTTAVLHASILTSMTMRYLASR